MLLTSTLECLHHNFCDLSESMKRINQEMLEEDMAMA